MQPLDYQSILELPRSFRWEYRMILILRKKCWI